MHWAPASLLSSVEDVSTQYLFKTRRHTIIWDWEVTGKLDPASQKILVSVTNSRHGLRRNQNCVCSAQGSTLQRCSHRHQPLLNTAVETELHKPYQFDAVPKLINQPVSRAYWPSFSPVLTQLKYFKTWRLHAQSCCGHLFQCTPLHTSLASQMIQYRNWQKSNAVLLLKTYKKGLYIHCLLNKCCVHQEQNSVPVVKEKRFLKTRPLCFKMEHIIPCCSLLLFLLLHTFSVLVSS